MVDSIVNLGPTKGIANIVIPQQGPRVLACEINFAASPTVEVFTLLSTFMGNIDYVQGAYVDNSNNPAQLTLLVNSTQQKIILPAYSQGYVSILFTQVPDLVVSSTQANVTVPLHFYNVPIQGSIWLTNDSAPGSGGLTDAQLRASPVPVSMGGTAYTDRSIASLTGSSQSLAAANANRKILFITNPGATEIWVNLVGGAAVANGAGSVPILPNGSILLDTSAPTGAINVIGTAGAVVTAYEG